MKVLGTDKAIPPGLVKKLTNQQLSFWGIFHFNAFKGLTSDLCK